MNPFSIEFEGLDGDEAIDIAMTETLPGQGKLHFFWGNDR